MIVTNYEALYVRLQAAVESSDQAALLELAGDFEDARDRLAWFAQAARAWLNVELSRGSSEMGAPSREALEYAESVLRIALPGAVD